MWSQPKSSHVTVSVCCARVCVDCSCCSSVSRSGGVRTDRPCCRSQEVLSPLHWATRFCSGTGPAGWPSGARPSLPHRPSVRCLSPVWRNLQTRLRLSIKSDPSPRKLGSARFDRRRWVLSGRSEADRLNRAGSAEWFWVRFKGKCLNMAAQWQHCRTALCVAIGIISVESPMLYRVCARPADPHDPDFWPMSAITSPRIRKRRGCLYYTGKCIFMVAERVVYGLARF